MREILKKVTGVFTAAVLFFVNMGICGDLEVKAAAGDNLLSVSSFEDGVTTGLSAHASANMMTLEVKEGVARTGNKSLYVATKSVAQYRALKLNTTVEEGKWYKISAYFKLDGEQTTTRQYLAWFLTDGSVYFNQNSDTYTKYKAATAGGSNFSASSDGVSGLNSTDWTEISTIFKAPANSVELKFTHARNSATDNFYLYMDDISLVEVEPELIFENTQVTIPAYGESDVELDFSIKAGGKTLAYDKSGAILSLDTDYPGVSITDNKIVITDEAVNSDVRVNFTNASESISGSTTVELSAQTDVPELRDFEIQRRGDDLVANYKFYDPDCYSDFSEYEWLYSDTEIGGYTLIEGVEQKEFTPSKEHYNKYIKCICTPKNSEETVGERVERTVFYGAEVAPVAENVVIIGEPLTTTRLQIKFDYFDENGDARGECEYQWYRCDSNGNSREAIPQANNVYYILSDDDIGSYITASVIPVNTGVPPKGDIAYAQVPVGPVIKRIISKGENILSSSSFEDEEMSDIASYDSENMMTLEVREGIARTGNKSLYVATETVGQYRGMKVTATVEKDKWYKISAYCKLDSEHSTSRQFLAWFLTNGSVYFNQNSDTYTKYKAATAGGSNFSASSDGVSGLNSTDWTEISTIFKAPANSVELKFTHARNSSTDNFYLYMDDISLVEVVPELVFENTQVTIPAYGESDVELDFSIKAGGKTLAYDKSGAVLSLADNCPGVSIQEGKKLVISDEAVNGNVTVNFTNASGKMTGSGTVTLSSLSDKPEARGLKITRNGEKLTADYMFYDPNSGADTSEYEWLFADESDGNYTPISNAGGKSYTPKDEYANGYIMVAVTPKSSGGGIPGDRTESLPVYGTEAPPIAQNVQIKGKLSAKETLTAVFDFIDPNGDEKGVCKYQWYRCDSSGKSRIPIDDAESADYTLTNDDINSYITVSVIPVSVTAPTDGELAYPIVPVGPIGDENTNIAENGGFEDDTKLTESAYDENFPKASSTHAVLSINDDKTYVRSGERSLKVSETTGQYVNVAITPQIKANTLYELSMWVKIDPSSAMTKAFVYSSSNTVFLPDLTGVAVMNAYESTDATITLSSTEWIEVKRLFYCPGTTGETVAANVDFRTGKFASASSFIFYIDDLYVSEALPKAELVGSSLTAEIPKNEQTAVKENFDVNISTKSGDVFYLANENAVLSLKEDYNGVNITDKTITITNEAYEQEIIIQAKYSDYNLVCDIPYQLTYSGETKPEARNTAIKGELTENAILEAKYDYYHGKGTTEGGTGFQWSYSSTENGTYTPIENATSSTYTVLPEQVNGFIKVTVTPKAIDGTSGKPSVSPAALKPVAPYTENIIVNGKHFVDEVLTASYDFVDKNFNGEAQSIYKWYRSNSKNGPYLPIDGQSTKTYTLTEADCEKYIKFSVVPVSDSAPNDMQTEYFSEAFDGPMAPVVSNISISGTKSAGNILTVNYDYYHKYGAAEKNSIVEWYDGTNRLHIGYSYTVDSSLSGKSIYVTITPVSEKMPYYGASVKSNSVSISSGNGGGGGGGSSFGGGKVTNTSKETTPEKDNTEVSTPSVSAVFTDVQNHWARESIENMYKKDYITGVSENSFEPDRNITRAEFCAILCRVFQFEEAEDSLFEDVNSKDWYYTYVNAAASAGIVQGSEGRFAPLKDISRQEMAVMMLNVLKHKEYSLPEIKEIKFDDEDIIDSWAKDAVAILSDLKMLEGSDNKYYPKNSATRAEASVVIERLITLTNK